MRYILFITLSLLTISLSSCGLIKGNDFEYEDFLDNTITTHSEIETLSNNRYIVYYYGINCSSCITVKQEMLSFFSDFELIDFHLLDASSAIDTPYLTEFQGTPSISIYSDNQVIESYFGLSEVRSFINKYKDMELDYDDFTNQHLTNYQDVLDVQNDTYILYYYLENCPYCMAAKDDFLAFAISKSVGDVFLMNGALVDNPDDIPTELTILNSGTPILVIMSNGVFTNEYYSGLEDVLEYINRIGSNDITSDYIDNN